MKPPTLDVIEQQLRALGVDPRSADSNDERVYRAFVAHWKKHKTPPSLDEMREASGITGTTMDSTVRRLVTNGRLIRMQRRGQYVPHVTRG